MLEPRFADRLAGVTDVGFPADLEAVLLLEPDVILAVGGTSVGDTIDVAGAGDIAPVAVANPEIYNDWQLGMAFWSDVLGTPEVYAEMAQNYDARVAELQDALAQSIGQPGAQPRDLEVSVVAASTYDVSLWLPDTPPGSVLADVGPARPDAQSLVGDAAVARFGAAQYVPVSDERLDLAGGDALFYFTYAAADAETARAEADFIGELEQNPLWRSLGAVQNERAFFFGGHCWRTGCSTTSSPISRARRRRRCSSCPELIAVNARGCKKAVEGGQVNVVVSSRSLALPEQNFPPPGLFRYEQK